MKQEQLYEILRHPLVTEKSTLLSAARKYVFKVLPDATKSQIKSAVESLFKVKVTKVNVLNRKGKVKTFRGRTGVQCDMKKAIVTLAEKNEIDLSVGIK